MMQKTMRMKLYVKSAKGCIKLVLMEYHSLLRTNSLKEIMEKISKLAIRLVLSAVKSLQLYLRLEQDVLFAYHHLNDNFNEFMRSAVDITEFFKKVYAVCQVYAFQKIGRK